MRLYTIGFTKKSAETFFETLRNSGARHVVDVRLKNVSQLAGFTKKADLAYFLRRVAGIGYVHVPLLAPTQEMLDAYKKNHGSWATYERQFLDLIKERRIEKKVSRDVAADGCLMCSEEKPHHCHRRLIAEYLQQYWGDVEIVHLG
jgi:uncharacterized protein (DUF488 family)